ncbi:PREDICTED: uncharacterized protein LOC108559039, partial [Nicrophorus vespilloides]
MKFIILVISLGFATIILCEKSRMVLITTDKRYHSFYVPISKEPVVTWMDTQDGIYPNVSPINSEVEIGSEISLLIFMKDKSRLYDLKINRCVAYDEENLKKSNNSLTLYSRFEKDKSKSKKYKNLDWKREPIANFTSLFYSEFEAFKFPDHDRIFLTCDIE